MKTIEIGDFRVTLLTDGLFRLDGGAMFGIVPRVLWEKVHPPDDRNRILLGLVSLLIERGERKILVEAGIGDKFSPKEEKIYAIDRSIGLVGALRERGIEPGEIDRVVLTHLHFDHSGNLTRTVEGATVPVFENASHVVQERELALALDPPERARPSYVAENIVPVEAAGLFETVSGEAELEPGLRVAPTPGHTPGHQSVWIEGGGTTLVFTGDLIPTAGHTHPPYTMGFDLEPAITVEKKNEFLERAVRDGWLLTWPHEPTPYYGRVAIEGKRYRVEPAG
jgi:glyoxylase-like metal-dependent hydrolase (beta-lactamase superfamily II)